VLVGWGAGELSCSFLQGADLGTVRALSLERAAALTVIAHAFSWVGSGFLILPAAGVCCLVFAFSRRIGAAALLVLSSAGAVAIFFLDKLLVGRPRPPIEHLEAPLHSSFPSGHATLATAFYLSLLMVLGGERRSWARAAGAVAFLLLIAGITLARVYLGVHYPSDVAAGASLGAAWTVLSAALLRRLTIRRGRQRTSGATGGARIEGRELASTGAAPIVVAETPDGRSGRLCHRPSSGSYKRLGLRDILRGNGVSCPLVQGPGPVTLLVRYQIAR
jgi:undecaprenyl-diphosphatase